MKCVLLIATLFGVIGALDFKGVAQDEDLQTKSISVCPFQLTPAARTASFRFSFIYRLRVSKEGTSKLDEISSSQRNMKSKFVRDDLFRECLAKWKLQPEGTYLVSFYVGTTTIGVREGMPFNYMTISDPLKRRIIIELSFADTDVLKISEPISRPQ